MTSDQGAVPIPDEPATRFAAHDVCFSGTSSVLYAGRDEASGREVAVKVLRDTAFPSPADRARALRELQKLATVKHPAIARIVAVGEGDGRLWVARELIEGESLAERLARNGPMGTAETARVASQIAAALGELHRHGVLHRDLRPGHVLIEPSGAVRVIDAALGRVYRTPDNRATTGTPGYVSPESIAGKLVSFRSDLYSLGATVYEMLTGAPPFGLDPPRVLTAQLESDAPALRLAVPPALARLVASLLSREPRERPFSAQQVERQLEPMAFAPEADEDPSSTTVVGSTEDLEPEAVSDGGLGTGLGDDDEDFEEPTQLSEASSLVAEARRLSAASAQIAAPPPSSAGTPSGTANAPAATPRAEGTGATRLPGAVARTNKPGLGGDPLHKPTLLGISPVVPPGAKPQAPYGGARAAAQAASSTPPAGRAAEGSGRVARTPPRDTSDEFDEAVDTVVQEDSRIFGVPAFGQSNPHGTAVPPLPETLAAQVLTGATRVRRASEAPPASNSGFTQLPTQPDAQPLPGRNIMPGGEIKPAMSGAPEVAPQAPYYPPGAMGMGGYPSGPSGPYPAQGFPGSGGYAAYPPPGAAASGGYPPAMPMGAYPPQGPRPTGASYRPATTPDLRALLPWLFAGIGIAGLAGAGGYYVATRSRNHVTPVEPAPRVAPIVVPPVMPPGPIVPPVVLPSAPPVGHAPVVVAPSPLPAPVVVAPHPAVAPPTRPSAPPPPLAVAPVAPVVPRHPAPVHHETPLEHAHAQIAHHDLAGARQTLAAASREQPSNPEIHAALGDVAVRLRELPTAIGEFRNASRLAPRNTGYLHRLANAQVAWNDRAGAVTTLRMLLQINPRDAAAQSQLDQLSHPGTASPGATRPTSSGTANTRPASTVPVFGPPPRTGTQPAPTAAPSPTSTSIFHR